MKIGVIQPRISYYEGGGEKVQIEYSKRLAATGHEVTIYTFQPLRYMSCFYWDLLSSNNSNLIIKEFPVPKEYSDIFEVEPGEDRNRWDKESLLFNQIIFSSLEVDNPDVILSCYILDGVFRPLHIPAVLHLSGYPTDYLEIRKSFLRFFDATVSISNNVKKRWEEYLIGDKNFVINTGVTYDDSEDVVNSKFSDNLVFAGRLIERKGVGTLIDTVAILTKKYNNLHLWIIGVGPFKARLSEKVEIYGLQKNITLVGQANKIYDYFRMADICVFPSYEKEGLMGVVLEAMAAGKPVITTTDNGNEDVISNGINGILVSPKDVRQLTDAIDKLLADPALRLKIGTNAKDYVKKKLTWEKATDKLINVFNKVIR